MFTGIVKDKQQVKAVTPADTGVRLVLEANESLVDGLEIGASVALAGVCLTVVEIRNDSIHFDVVHETLERSTLGNLKAGDMINVERSFRVGDEVGGHILSGHIIGNAELVEIQDTRYTFQVPVEWMKYILEKGYVALDGCSLTIVEPNNEAGTFSVAFIPETLEKTTFGQKKVGDRVNIEIDSQTQAIVETTERILAQRGLD